MQRRMMGALVVALSLLALIGQFTAGQEVQLEVVGLFAQVSSIRVPYYGYWVETGPISVGLSPGVDGIYTTTLDLESGYGEVIWPAHISCPFLHETGVGALDVLFVGTIHMLDDGLIACFDAAMFEMGEAGWLVVSNKNNVQTPERPPDLLEIAEMPAILPGVFVNSSEEFFRIRELEWFREDLNSALDSLAEVTGEDPRSTGFTADRAMNLYEELYPPCEIVVYFEDTATFAVADLIGEVVFKLTAY